MNFSSKLVEQAVEAFASLPGIGKKTALRLVLHMIKQPEEVTKQFTQAIAHMREHIQFCKRCHNLSDEALCAICANPRRDHQTICVVESIRDVMAIEETSQYRGAYHVLGGVISPINGVGPGDLFLSSLYERVQAGEVKELIMALSPTLEGDTTIYYLSNQLQDFDIKITTIARGVSFGGELEYADEVTLGRSILSRVPYQKE